MSRSFSCLPTEKIKLLKKSGIVLESVEAVFGDNTVLIQDGTLDIEENDVVQRELPNGRYESYIILDTGFKRGIGSFPDHYQARVTKEIASYQNTDNSHTASKGEVFDLSLINDLFEMDKGLVLELSNSKFKDLVYQCSEIDVYTDSTYITESSKAKKLKKIIKTEDTLTVCKVLLSLLENRERIIKKRIAEGNHYIDPYADDAKEFKNKIYRIIGNDHNSTTKEFDYGLSKANKVLHDLITIGEKLCTTYEYNSSSSEDTINSFFKNMLHMAGYNETKDQTLHGISSSGKSAGEVDILISEQGKEIALFEGLKLDSIDKKYISAHIKKAIDNYNPLGTATFIVSYVSASDYSVFWEKYFEYIKQYDYNMEIVKEMTEQPSPNAATRLSKIVLSRDKFEFSVVFLCFKLNNQ